jgi:8'-apo-carotenoid 13,14-cleaving dioxygenase
MFMSHPLTGWRYELRYTNVIEERDTLTNTYFAGNFAPVTDELLVEHLQVIGEIPADLEGMLLRNGPNPVTPVDPARHHWFSGTGMIHGVRLRGGRAEWYRNRWVRGSEVTDALGEPAVPGTARRAEFSPNTNVGAYAGKLWALVEAGTPPAELDADLNTVCRSDFSGTLPHGFTAHPKVDPATGDMHAMCYSWQDLLDHIEYVVVGRDGMVKHITDVRLPGMSMVHDMSITQRYAVVYDLPVTVDLDIVFAGTSTFPFRWNPGYGARIGLVPLGGDGADVVWCELEPCYAYHPMNAYDAEDGTVVIDICRYDKMFERDVFGPAGDCLPTLDRWIVDPVARTVTETRVDDRTQEFPRIRPDLTGRPHRYGYTAVVGEAFAPGAVLKHDLVTGTSAAHDFGTGRGSAEPAFVARSREEDDGWLLSYVYDATTDSSELVVLDAQDIAAPPRARVVLPRRVPHGFHGNWVPDSALRQLRS